MFGELILMVVVVVIAAANVYIVLEVDCLQKWSE